MTQAPRSLLKPVTYSRSITVALTHVCHNRCAYCGYRMADGGVLNLDEVREIISRGQEAGCREVLVLSGERPWLEDGFPLDETAFIERVYDTCVEALRLGLLPHTNIGVLTRSQLACLQEVNASMGLMLETANRALPAHAQRPGKDIDERIRHIAAAGELRIPFTTGILIGIGESHADRTAALQVIKDLHRRYGHIQEVIIQNFQPKPGTPMADWPPPGEGEMVETVRLAREMLPDIAIQVPPNLNERYVDLLAAGASDLGGISPAVDEVNPECRWPTIGQLRAELSDRAYALRERLPVYPEVDADLSPVADRLRQALVGDQVTYVVNCNINFTNKCVGSCRFCAFRVSQGDPAAFELSIPEILAKAEQAVDEGATELCIQGGLHPRLRLDYYTGMLRAIHDRYPELHLHAFSPMEVKWLADKERVSVEEALTELKRAGIGSMPGTAAEILVDEVRQQICPTKLSTAEWVHVIRAAHKLGIPTTSTMMFGHIETWAHRVQHLRVILDIQRETGGFTEFVLLPFVPWNTGLGHQFAIEPISLEEILKVTAYARLFFGKDLVNIQGSWVKTGVAGMQKALNCGANDFGGTLMEENISRSAGSPYGERLTREEIEAAIRGVGRTPVERDTLYNLRPMRGDE